MVELKLDQSMRPPQSNRMLADDASSWEWGTIAAGVCLFVRLIVIVATTTIAIDTSRSPTLFYVVSCDDFQ